MRFATKHHVRTALQAVGMTSEKLIVRRIRPELARDLVAHNMRGRHCRNAERWLRALAQLDHGLATQTRVSPGPERNELSFPRRWHSALSGFAS